MNALTDWLTSNKVGAGVGDFLTQKAAPFAAKVFESPLGKVIMAADKIVEEGWRENVGTGFLTLEYGKRGGNVIQAAKKAADTAERISYGEALAFSTAQNTNLPLATKLIEQKLGADFSGLYKKMPLLDVNYDLLDEEDRQKAQDSAAYQLVTGLTDIGLELYSAKGLGILASGLRKAARMSNTLTPATAGKVLTEVEEGLSQARVLRQENPDITINDITPINGPMVHVLNAAKSRDPLELLANPMVATSNRPEQLARLVASTDSLEETAYLLLADKGIPGSLQRLNEVAPRFADVLEIQSRPVNLAPLTNNELDNLFTLVDSSESAKLANVLDDVLRKDSNFETSWQSWYKSAEITTPELNWSPTKSTFLEQLRSGQYNVLAERLVGKGSGRVRETGKRADEGIQETIIGDGLFRPFRVMSLSSLRLRPRNYIELTGLRPLDSIQEISAGLLAARTMRASELRPVREKLIRDWIETPFDETQRAVKLKDIELEAALAMGNQLSKKFGLPLESNVNQAITDALARVQAKRDELIVGARKTENGIVSKDVQADEVLAINETFKSKLASSVPMLDFRILEREIASELKAASILGKFNKTIGGVSETGRKITVAFDSFERAFSAAVLIRPGYIPKNSIFEPAMRVLGLVHAISLPKIWRNTSFSEQVKSLDTGQTTVKQLDVFAPDTPGGLAAKAAIDPSITLANATQPGIFERITRGNTATQTINPKNPLSKKYMDAYWRQYATEVQVLRNDPVARRVMEGLSDDQIVEYLLRDLSDRANTSDLSRIAQGRIASGQDVVANAAFAEMIVSESRNIINQLIPNAKTQKEIAASGKVFKVKDAKRYFKEKDLPSLETQLPFYAGLANQGDKFLMGYQKTINAGFKFIAKPEMVLFRSPFGRYYGNQALELMVDTAKKNGLDITDDLYRNSMLPLAQEYALRKVEDTFYAIRRMNNVQYYSRFLMGFPNAMYNSLKFWMKTGAANPYSFALLENLRTSPWNVGMVVDDEGNALTKEEAEDKTAYLMLNTVTNKMGELQPFVYKMNTQQLNFLINGPSPNWFFQANINTVVQNYPSLELKMKDVLGERLYNQFIYGGIPRGVVPPSVQQEGRPGGISFGVSLAENILRQFFIPAGLQEMVEVVVNRSGKEELKFKKSAIAGTIAAVHNARRLNWEFNDPDGPEPDPQESIDRALELQFWKAFRRLISPLGITEQPVSIFFREEWDRIENKYIEDPSLLQPNQSVDDATTFEFGQLYGDEGYRFLISSFQYNVPIAPYQESYKRLKDNKWLENWVGDNPSKRMSIAGIVLNPVIPGEYSPAVSAYLRTATFAGKPVVGERKSFTEREAEALEEDGWREYSRIVKEKDAALQNNNRRSKSLNSRVNADIGAEYRNQLEDLRGTNKIWAEAFGDSNNRFPEVTNLINEALKQPRFMAQINNSEPDKQLWNSIRQWRNVRSQLYPEWLNSRPNSRQRSAIKEQYENEVFKLTQENTYFADFANRYFVGDPMMDIREITEEAATTETPATGGFSIPDINISDILGVK
jgi:hypothetical protein